MTLYEQLEVIPHYENVKVIQNNYGVRKEITASPMKRSDVEEIREIIAVIDNEVVATEINVTDRPFFEITVR